MARYYDSRTGTFCSADPLAGSPGDPQSWNRYPYGRNDPIDITDPSGKSWASFFEFLGEAALSYFVPGAGFAIGINNTGNALFNGQPPPPMGFGGVEIGSSWNGSTTIGDGGLTNGVQNALGLPTMADVGGPIFDAQNGSPNSLSQFTTCLGEATLTGVGGNQAHQNGALFSKYPALAGGSIRGGTFGTVAVQKGFLGLSTKQLRQYGTQITINPIFNQGQIQQLGGPTGPLSVSDYGDPHIQGTSGTAFDIYRFPTKSAGRKFGRLPWQSVAISFPTASGGSCPPGFVSP